MKAGLLRDKIQRYRLEEQENPDTGEIRRVWMAYGTPIWAQLTSYRARERNAHGEVVTVADAAYYIRLQHEIADGWRVEDMRTGIMYDVVCEPNRDKMFNLLRCTKVND